MGRVDRARVAPSNACFESKRGNRFTGVMDDAACTSGVTTVDSCQPIECITAGEPAKWLISINYKRLDPTRTLAHPVTVFSVWHRVARN
jgi:hypothetical protein